jgi:hypothetical protein
MRACPVGLADKGACARCFSELLTSGFGRRSREVHRGDTRVRAERRSFSMRGQDDEQTRAIAVAAACSPEAIGFRGHSSCK